MGEPFDPYRDALVIETETVWPEELAGVDPEQRKRIEKRLHAAAREAKDLAYVRLHAGFCRRITVTVEDVERAR